MDTCSPMPMETSDVFRKVSLPYLHRRRRPLSPPSQPQKRNLRFHAVEMISGRLRAHARGVLGCTDGRNRKPATAARSSTSSNNDNPAAPRRPEQSTSSFGSQEESLDANGRCGRKRSFFFCPNSDKLKSYFSLATYLPAGRQATYYLLLTSCFNPF